MREAGIDYAAQLHGLAEAELRRYLAEHSGLPGPRANLTLMAMVAEMLTESMALAFADDDDEYLACCGVVALGRILAEDSSRDDLSARLTAKAAHPNWRVREAAAMAAQRVGDANPALLRQLVADWVAHGDPLVVRAGIAAVCEPRLLRDSLTAAAALDACAAATQVLASVPLTRRSEPSVRVLRQGLAYCWSVAVAGSPQAGLPMFLALDCSDPDLAWVVRQNRAKQRLKKLL